VRTTGCGYRAQCDHERDEDQALEEIRYEFVQQLRVEEVVSRPLNERVDAVTLRGARRRTPASLR